LNDEERRLHVGDYVLREEEALKAGGSEGGGIERARGRGEGDM
jgi:hypothetical protein